MISTLIVLKIQAYPNRKCLSGRHWWIWSFWLLHTTGNEHKKCVQNQFGAILFLMATSNCMENTIPEKFLFSSILSHRKKLHNKSQIFNLEFIGNPCSRTVETFCITDTSKLQSKTIEIPYFFWKNLLSVGFFQTLFFSELFCAQTTMSKCRNFDDKQTNERTNKRTNPIVKFC